MFGSRVDEEVSNSGVLGVAIKTVVDNMSREETTGKRDSMRWIDEEVLEKIQCRKTASRTHRKVRKEHGEGSEEQKIAWEKYLEAKKQAHQTKMAKMREVDATVMQEIKRSDNKTRDLWKHIRNKLDRGKKQNSRECLNKLTKPNGEEITEEEDIKTEINRVWGDLFCKESIAVVGIDKEKILGGLDELKDVDEEEIQHVIDKLKNGKAVGEDDIAGEYLKALKTVSRDQLRTEINNVFRGGPVPVSWKRTRVLLIPKGPEQDNIKNYRPIAIMSVICKLAMMILRNRLDKIVEDTNFLGDIQGGFRKKRRTEDNLYILERTIETVKYRKKRIFLGFLDLEKAYDKVNRNKLFDVLRRYGIGERFVEVIEKVYTGSEVKFVWNKIETEWVETRSGVRQGCPLSPLLFNIYIREVGTKIETSGLGVKFPIISENEAIEQWMQLAGLMYADDIVLIAESGEEIQELFCILDEVAKEYGLSFSEKKSKVLRIAEECKDDTWKLNGKEIGEATGYKYLGVQVKGGLMGGIDAMEDRLKECRKVVGMIKFASNRSGDKLIFGREAWKGIAVSKLMYGCGAIAGELKHIKCMDGMQNQMGRWLWSSGQNVSNALIRGEIGWSTFKEREAKVKLDWFRRIIFEEGPVSKIGRATVAELGTVSKWWRRVDEIADMIGLGDLMNLIALKRVNTDGLNRLGMDSSEKEWIAKINKCVETWGQIKWRESMGNSIEMEEYRNWKSIPALEEYANGSEAARIRMLLRGGYLPLRGNEKFGWRNRNTLCRCGEVETVEHWIFQCDIYRSVRRQWNFFLEVGGSNIMNILKGYSTDKEISEKGLKFLGSMWNLRKSNENNRND